MQTFPIATPNGAQHPRCRAVLTGERRAPRAGEWYVSGAIVEAYRAPHDLTTPHLIARLVRVKRVVTLQIEEWL